MIADLYKELKDCKDFYERCEEKPLGKLSIPMSYEEVKFICSLVELTILVVKLSEGKSQ